MNEKKANLAWHCLRGVRQENEYVNFSMVSLSEKRRRVSFICTVVLVDAGLQNPLTFELFDKLYTESDEFFETYRG